MSLNRILLVAVSLLLAGCQHTSEVSGKNANDAKLILTLERDYVFKQGLPRITHYLLAGRYHAAFQDEKGVYYRFGQKEHGIYVTYNRSEAYVWYTAAEHTGGYEKMSVAAFGLVGKVVAEAISPTPAPGSIVKERKITGDWITAFRFSDT